MFVAEVGIQCSAHEEAVVVSKRESIKSSFTSLPGRFAIHQLSVARDLLVLYRDLTFRHPHIWLPDIFRSDDFFLERCSFFLSCLAEPHVMEERVLDNTPEAVASKHGSRSVSPDGYWRKLQAAKLTDVNVLSGDQDARDHDGLNGSGANGAHRPTRYRPRTFPYRRYLPYRHDDRELESLSYCLRRLYVAVASGDFVPGATHWTRELRGWMQLKFDLPRDDRIKLAKLYYELALAPGLETSACDRFASMFTLLTK